MKRLTTVLAPFVGSREGELGGKAAPPEQIKDLIARLDVERGTNRALVWVIVSLHIALFAGALALVWYFRDSPKALVATLGGSYLSLMKILSSLKDLWAEKSVIDVLLGMAPLLPPEEFATLVKEVYYSAKDRGRKSSPPKSNQATT